jgi:hypothetical protein
MPPGWWHSSFMRRGTYDLAIAIEVRGVLVASAPRLVFFLLEPTSRSDAQEHISASPPVQPLLTVVPEPLLCGTECFKSDPGTNGTLAAQ